MATNSKNSQNINYTNGVSTNKLSHKIGMGMMSIMLMLSAATIATLEVSNQNQSVESPLNSESTVLMARNKGGS